MYRVITLALFLLLLSNLGLAGQSANTIPGYVNIAESKAVGALQLICQGSECPDDHCQGAAHGSNYQFALADIGNAKNLCNKTANSQSCSVIDAQGTTWGQIAIKGLCDRCYAGSPTEMGWCANVSLTSGAGEVNKSNCTEDPNFCNQWQINIS